MSDPDKFKRYYTYVLMDLKMALHCHGCGVYTQNWKHRYGGEYCSKGCWDPCTEVDYDEGLENCPLTENFGRCGWCTFGRSYKPLVTSVYCRR
jgi:hypothetical protein